MIAGNLFTRDYLLEGITRSQEWLALADTEVIDLKAKLLRSVQSLLAVHRPNEAQTEKTLIYPVLVLLGWNDIEVQQILSSKGRKQVPDALLFADEQARNSAVAERDHWKRYQHGLAVVEAKRWARALDRPDKSEAHEEGVPSNQMLQYLSRVDIQTSGKVRLGILTNGVKWRLYFQGALSVSEDFFEIDLGKVLELPGHELDLVERANPLLTPLHCLRLFALTFRKQAFLPVDGARTFHDLARDEGKIWEARVTRDLSHLVFHDLYPGLVAAIHRHDPDRPAEIDAAYLESVRQSSLILLYRLLFVVYAEDRELLPDRQEPYKSYCLTTMRGEIADRLARGLVFSSTIATFWPKLTAVFGAISEGDDALGIPPYNGGLFARDSATLLARIELPDAVVAHLIFKLSHREETPGAFRYINYRDLGVQQLGTIQKAMAQALAMQKLERVNDIDIAEVHQSKTLFDGIESETRPFNSFVKLLYALDWLKLDKADETSVKSWLDGQYGDPFDIARGRLTLGPPLENGGTPQSKDVLEQIPGPVKGNATRFAAILSRARELVRKEAFHNWQVAFPGVWTQWESLELRGGFHAVIGNPPYVRQELIRPYKAALEEFYETFAGQAETFMSTSTSRA